MAVHGCHLVARSLVPSHRLPVAVSNSVRTIDIFGDVSGNFAGRGFQPRPAGQKFSVGFFRIVMVDRWSALKQSGKQDSAGAAVDGQAERQTYRIIRGNFYPVAGGVITAEIMPATSP